MSRNRKRILFFAEGITMAHFTRPAVLAEALDPNEWEICFCTPRRFHSLVPSTVSTIRDLPTLDPKLFLELLARGAVPYSQETIQQYVTDDLAAIQSIEPDLVIGDCRLSLCISAPVSNVPFGSIFNAYWSRYARQSAVVPQLPITRWISPTLLAPLSLAVRPFLYALNARPLNAVRRQYGLPKLSHDVRDFYTAGDLVLYPDIPEFVPLDRPPAHHHFIGPCLWSMKAPKPTWWDEAMSSPRPKVFVALGSSGPIERLPEVLDAVSRLSAVAIVATSGRDVHAGGANTYLADLLPFEDTARHCAAIVSHGGSSGIYPALAAGTPVLAIPANVDTHLAAATLERTGAGLSVRVERASVENVVQALGRVISDPRFEAAAKHWASVIDRYQTKTRFADALRWWQARHQPNCEPSR